MKEPNPLALRRNHRIKAPQVQVLDADGQPLGTMWTTDAINRALAERLDLVEIGPMPTRRFVA